MNRADFQQLAEMRLDDAKALVAMGRYSAAYYLAGYAVECALKACISRQTQLHEFPPKDTNKSHYQHDFNILLNTAELKDLVQPDLKARTPFGLNWETVFKWGEQQRYNYGIDQQQAEELIQAIEDVQDGVLTWLRQRW